MSWRWDLRPPEFIALPAADRKRVWRRCYFAWLLRPVMLLLALGFGIALALVGAFVSYLLGPTKTVSTVVLRGCITAAANLALVALVVRYAFHALYDELRKCATQRCLKCWYDLTGNLTGVCPECGTPRHQ